MSSRHRQKKPQFERPLRSLVYGLLTALLAAVYAGLIIGLESLAGLIAGQAAINPLVLVISTLVIYVLFRPLRRRVQAIIDRRFYRSKYDAARTLADFSATLRNEVDLNQLREQLLEVVQETMQPTFASLWLRPAEHERKHQVPWRATPPGSSDGGGGGEKVPDSSSFPVFMHERRLP
jgi:hypothetical protein